MGTTKTTIYLPDELKAAVEREAKLRGTSEAQLIRDAISKAVTRPKPVGGFIHGKEPISERVDELLKGFGER